jgi:8-oxo-dGTP diphosphatase
VAGRGRTEQVATGVTLGRVTTYLVRHASAGLRNDADPSDEQRPLDAEGVVQAAKLSSWLRHEPIDTIVSSPYLRCRQTVEPLAKVLGLEVVVSDELGEGTPIERSWKLLASVADGTAVLCSHGDVIPDLIRRAQLRGMHVPGKSGAAKGSVWTLQHWEGDAFATGIYTPIPRST